VNVEGRIAVAFGREVTKSTTTCLCAACVEVLAVTGAGITIMGGDQAGPICVSNPNIKALEDLQFTIGQGPCRDAFHSGAPVHAPTLDGTAVERWPPFVELARSCAIGAVFAYPLISKGSRIGVLTLYQQTEGDLTTRQHDDSIALAEILAETLLSLQEAAPDGTLAVGLDAAVAYRAELYQASGMIAVQLQIPAGEALLRIRAHAFAQSQPVDVVAAEIVARRLRLADDRHTPGDGA
jgi:GAF domain